MKIYVVNCGKYDCYGLELVTEKLEVAVKLISERVCISDIFDCFSDMECWENGKKLYTYYSDLILEKDILKEINKIEAELTK